MDAKEAALKEKLDFHLKQATEVAAQLQAIDQGNRTPHYDDIELPAHSLGQRFSRAIQEERVRDLALRELKDTRCPECKRKCRVEIDIRPVTSMDGPIELTEPVAKCRHCRRSFFPSACSTGTR
jgi:hypothetical protein